MFALQIMAELFIAENGQSIYIEHVGANMNMHHCIAGRLAQAYLQMEPTDSLFGQLLMKLHLFGNICRSCADCDFHKVSSQQCKLWL